MRLIHQAFFKSSTFFIVALAAPISSEATVVINFTNPALSANNPIPASYGSNATSSTTGITVSEGGAPDIAVDWSGGDWDFHTSAFWQTLDPVPVAVAQADIAGGPNLASIVFTPSNGAAVHIGGFDIGHASDQTEADFDWTVSVVNTSTSGTEKTIMTSALGAADTEYVSVDFTGESNTAYRLDLVSNAASPTGGAGLRGAIDNLTFSQVPEPSNFATIAAISALGLVVSRRRRIQSL